MLVHIISKIFVMFTLMGIGFVLDKRKVVSRDGLQSLSKVVIDVMMPALIFSSIVVQFNRHSIVAGYKLPLLGIMTFLVGAFSGWVLTKFLRERDHERKNTIIYLLTINNYGYLTLPLVFLLFGASGVAFLFLHNLGCHLVFWTLGTWLLVGGSFSLKSLKALINPPFIALIFSLMIPLLGIERFVPDIAVEICELLGIGVIPLIMLVIGSTMAEIEFKEGLLDKTMIWITAARLLIVPLIVILILKLLPMPEIFRNIAIVVAVMPAASSTPLFTKQYGGDTPIAAKAVFLTTILSALTIPVLLAVFLK